VEGGAGVRRSWRVEEDDGLPVAYVYDLAPATAPYAIAGIHRARLKVGVPFVIEADPTRIRRGHVAAPPGEGS
jgi:hypothetical protein